ncbi:MAG: DUF4835 family protein [Bacteroidota bacterium]
MKTNIGKQAYMLKYLSHFPFAFSGGCIGWQVLKPAYILAAILVMLAGNLSAQELNCNVTINSQGVEGIDKRVMADMKKNITDFLNLRTWTNDKYQTEERIVCNLVITISKNTGTKYEATAQIQSARPVFGTGYESVIINYLDKDWLFDYIENQPMDYNDNSYSSGLTSLLAYYAYLIIGYDNDTYARFGGKNMYTKAQQVANNAQNSPMKGWSTYDGMNSRIMLLENLLHQQVVPFREGLYSYYRLGLDVFNTKPADARLATLDMLKKIDVVVQNKPLCLIVNTFFDAKSTEIINIMSEADYGQRQQAYNILTKVDPTKTEQYSKLIKQ